MTKFQLEPKYYFGKNVVNENLLTELKNYKPKKVFLLYGGGSIKNNGLYQTIVSTLKKAKIPFVEHKGIEPNPKEIDTTKAIIEGRKNKVDLIIAAGGGSVIDASKVIATAIPNSNFRSAWDVVKKPYDGKKMPLPIFSIITIAATGSENNYGSVITNEKTQDKWGVQTPSVPCVCFEDPTYTLTVNEWQTGSGIFDIFSHLLEQYFNLNESFTWTINYLISNMKTLLEFAPKVIKNPNDYEARANILWTSSFALNGLASFNMNGSEWIAHSLEHALSAKYNVSHGAGLALITPTLMEYMCSKYEIFRQLTISLGKELFGVNSHKKCIACIRDFIKTIKMPTKYSDFKEIGKITTKDIEDLVKIFNRALPKHKDIAIAVYNKIGK